MVKTSNAARELALDIADLLPRGFPDKRTFEEAQSLIQAAISDLLEKAETIMLLANCDEHCSKKECKYRALAAALEPWQLSDGQPTIGVNKIHE